MMDEDFHSCRFCRTQALKLEEALERIRQLEDELNARSYVPPVELGLSASQSAMLGVFLRYDRVVTPDVLFDVTRNGMCRVMDQDNKLVQVNICKLRQKLKPFGIVIQTVYGLGWRLHPDGRDQLLHWNQREAA